MWLKALRWHQWAKNALLFVPLALGGNVATRDDLWRALLAFLIFGLTASAAYIVNDLADLDADRQHPQKKTRPFASGALSVPSGIVAAASLGVAAVLLAKMLNGPFAIVLSFYAALTLAYSVRLKRRPVLDVLILACLFTLRIAGGMVLLALPVSYWLLVFSMFFFFSLALIKRYAELKDLHDAGKRAAAGRPYGVDDMPFIMSAGIASAFAGGVVFVIYLANEHFQREVFTRPQWLWAICGVLLYWLMRVWFLAARGQMHQDPILFALRDRASLAMAALTGVFIALAW